jgi:hypothetical protein
MGAKLAAGEVNSSNLPQAYQSGLGTNDMLDGVTYTIDNYSAGAAVQIPFGRSGNAATRLKRGSDLMLRFGYTHPLDQISIGG